MIKLKKVGKIIGVIFLIVLILLIISTIIHQVLKKVDKEKYSIYGEYIEVNGKNMYISVLGDGEKTIVILPGSGATGSTVYYRPLAEKLAQNYKVVVVEYFGYGFSDDTKEERTNENIVKELRTCLKNANIEGPYILMPHSMSGIYSLYYAKTYPDEVEAIIGLDMEIAEYEYSIDWDVLYSKHGITEKKYKSQMEYPVILNYLVEKTGIMRWLDKIYNKDLYKKLESYNLYSDEELLIYSKELKNYPSIALLNEYGDTYWNNLEEMRNVKYPDSLPVIQFLSSSNIEGSKEFFGIDSLKINRDMIVNENIQSISIIEGSHSVIFLDGLTKICEETKEFIDKLE